jgi:chromosome segregation ATPase
MAAIDEEMARYQQTLQDLSDKHDQARRTILDLQAREDELRGSVDQYGVRTDVVRRMSHAAENELADLRQRHTADSLELREKDSKIASLTEMVQSLQQTYALFGFISSVECG